MDLGEVLLQVVETILLGIAAVAAAFVLAMATIPPATYVGHARGSTDQGEAETPVSGRVAARFASSTAVAISAWYARLLS